MSGTVFLVILIAVFLFFMYYSHGEARKSALKRKRMIERIKNRHSDEF